MTQPQLFADLPRMEVFPVLACREYIPSGQKGHMLRINREVFDMAKDMKINAGVRHRIGQRMSQWLTAEYRHPNRAFLVPIPSSNGEVSTNFDLCRTIRDETGIPIKTLLIGQDRESQCDRDNRGAHRWCWKDIGVMLGERPPFDENVQFILVDNLSHSGETLMAAYMAIKEAYPKNRITGLVYARRGGVQL